jgi:electron transfer flavoprotein beta subunit
MEGDLRLVVEMPLPAVVTVQTGINRPRYASLKGIMAAKKKEILHLTPDEMGIAASDVGAAGSALEPVVLALPPKGKLGEMLEGSPEEVAQELIRRIRENTGVI